MSLAKTGAGTVASKASSAAVRAALVTPCRLKVFGELIGFDRLPGSASGEEPVTVPMSGAAGVTRPLEECSDERGQRAGGQAPGRHRCATHAPPSADSKSVARRRLIRVSGSA